MRDYTNTDLTEIFLSDEEQRDLIAAAQDVPCVVTTDNNGREVVKYGRTKASEKALTALVEAFKDKAIRNVARTAKILDFEEAQAVLFERFVLAVREYDLDSDVPFSRDIRTLLRFELSDRERTSNIVTVKENVSARYFRLIHKHEGSVEAAYEECRTTANGFDPATFLAVHWALARLDSMDRGFDTSDQNPEGAPATGRLKVDSPIGAIADSLGNFDEDLAQADLVRWLFTKVADKEEAILRLRYGFSDLATENIRSAAGFRNDKDDLVMSDREVAQALNSSTPTVNRLRRAALATMRDALDSLATDGDQDA